MKRQAFAISTKHGTVQVFGYLQDGYGVHDAYGDWTVIHLRTGFACGFGVRTRHQALRLAAAIDAASPALKDAGRFGTRKGLKKAMLAQAMAAYRAERDK